MDDDRVGEYRVILIGGSSHTGKSTLAQRLAAYLGWIYRSTDKLARHPGRPWQIKPAEVPPHVADHYLSLSVDDLILDVLRHYRDHVGPLIENLVNEHAAGPSADRLVLEGSAILPELVLSLPAKPVAAIWLTASPQCFEQRIYRESQYASKTPREKAMIDQFLARTIQFNDRMLAAVRRFGLVSLEVSDASSPDQLMAACLELLQA